MSVAGWAGTAAADHVGQSGVVVPGVTSAAALFAACAVVFAATVATPVRWAVPLSVAAILAAVAVQPEIGQAVVTALSLTVAALMAALMRRLRADRSRQARLIDQLRATRAAEQRAAAMAERAHVARELHDILAHSLSALTVSLERTRLQAQVSGADAAVVEQLAQAHQTAGRGLSEARRAVGALRGEAELAPTALPDLASAFAARTGTPLLGRLEVAPPNLPPAVHLTMYRALQESLTNITRHARPAWVRLEAEYPPGRARLNVRDGGATALVPASAPADIGSGLRGLGERVALLGGSCAAGPTPDGWHVDVDLPR